MTVVWGGWFNGERVIFRSFSLPLQRKEPKESSFSARKRLLKNGQLAAKRCNSPASQVQTDSVLNATTRLVFLRNSFANAVLRYGSTLP